MEPKIGHLKSDHRMRRCFLKGLIGDAINAVLAAAGSNLLKLLRAIALAPGGLVVQLPASVEIHAPSGTKSVLLPPGAAMLDYVEGRILYGLGNEIRSLKVSSGSDTLLLKATAGRAVFATQDTHGLGWAEGSRLMFACGGCVSYTP